MISSSAAFVQHSRTAVILAVAALFFVAAVGKIRDPGAVFALVHVAVPALPLTWAIVWLTVVVESGIAMALLWPQARSWGLIACVVTLSAFSVLLTVAIMRGYSGPCGCTGRFASMTARQALLRNGALLGIAGLILITSEKKGSVQ